MCSVTSSGTEYSSARTRVTRVSESCAHRPKSASSSADASRTVTDRLIHSPSSCTCASTMPALRSHERTATVDSARGAIMSARASRDRCWPYLAWDGSETSYRVRSNRASLGCCRAMRSLRRWSGEASPRRVHPSGLPGTDSKTEEAHCPRAASAAVRRTC